MRGSAARAVIAAALLAWSLASTAQEALVDAVQMPAWLERDGLARPIAPGMALTSRDTVRTGADARLLVRLADGSAVKLGANGVLRLDEIVTRQDDGVFAAVMNVVKGAFRFTTAALQKARRREVSITVATATAGIRGTDLWGKAAPDKDIICLIEGDIEVTRGTDAPVRLDQPKSFYVAPTGQPPLPVAPVSDAQLAQWAAETEIEAGRGAARRGGRWKVNLASAASENEVLRIYEAVRAAGFAAELDARRRDGRRDYTVRIANLPSADEAEALAARLKGQFGVGTPRVTQ
jgi:cell division septation protein DedD